jgi:methionyl-tRNA formyltransferase
MTFRLVLLTGLGPEHRYVTRALAERFPRELQAVIVADPPPTPLGARWRRYRRRYTWPQLVSRVVAKTYRRVTRMDERRRSVLARLFAASPATEPGTSAPVHRVRSLNGAEALGLLDRLAPDIIAVYGTAVLRPPVLQQARTAVLNMHTGISPRYRGADTVFWPLHHGEPEWIGTTIHALDPGIDSGPIFATARPAITADDDEDTLFAKCVMAGARAYGDVIAAVAGGSARAQPQDLSEGREYRFVDRTAAAERRVRRLLRGGLLRRFVDHGREAADGTSP